MHCNDKLRYASQRIDAVYIHGATAADALATGPSEG